MTQTIEVTEGANVTRPLQNPQLQMEDSKLTRVLVVEDDLTLKSFWNHILSKKFKRIKVDWASTEELAEGMIRNRFQKNKPYDLVISDIFLAGQKTGLELWFNFADAATQFLFVSVLAENRFEQLMKGVKTQPFFLQKPLDPVQCKQILETIAINAANPA